VTFPLLKQRLSQRRGRPRRLGVRAGLAALLVLAASPARAQERDQRELEAKKACLGGHPDKGIELLADLYTDTNDPTYIYNQGRCFEQNGRAGEAVTRFREYLRKATAIAPDERAQLQKHIDELEAEGRTTTSPVAPPAPSAPAAPPTVVVVQSPSAEPSPERVRHLKILALVTGGVGVVAVGAGVVMGLRASSLSTEVSNDAKAGTYSQSKFDSGERAQTLEIVGYSVGAAALIAGGILYYLGAGSGHAESAPAVTASVDSSGVRAGIRMAF
jgi:hypothetical protein